MYFAAFNAAAQISAFPVASVSGWLSSKVDRLLSSWGRLESASLLSVLSTFMALIRVEDANLRILSIFMQHLKSHSGPHQTSQAGPLQSLYWNNVVKPFGSIVQSYYHDKHYAEVILIQPVQHMFLEHGSKQRIVTYIRS